MAMAAWLALASDDEIKKLKAEPTSFNQFEGHGKHWTYIFCAINYFVYGDAWDGEALFGCESVDCPTLENRNFGVVKPAQVKKVLGKLEKVDFKKLKKKIDDTDPDDLEEAEVTDFEDLEEGDSPSEMVTKELKSLIAFYKKALKGRYGVVMYTA